jgi:hypothetical protein
MREIVSKQDLEKLGQELEQPTGNNAEKRASLVLMLNRGMRQRSLSPFVRDDVDD